MAAPSAPNVAPIKPPSKELESMPLADTYYLMQDFVVKRNHLHTYCQLRNNFLDKTDKYYIWESTLPQYFLPYVNIFPEIIHLCAANYEPSQRVVKSSSGSILFYTTPDSINQMLNFRTNHMLLPFSINSLLQETSWLLGTKMEMIAETFMRAVANQTNRLHFLTTISVRWASY